MIFNTKRKWLALTLSILTITACGKGKDGNATLEPPYGPQPGEDFPLTEQLAPVAGFTPSYTTDFSIDQFAYIQYTYIIAGQDIYSWTNTPGIELGEYTQTYSLNQNSQYIGKQIDKVEKIPLPSNQIPKKIYEGPMVQIEGPIELNTYGPIDVKALTPGNPYYNQKYTCNTNPQKGILLTSNPYPVPDLYNDNNLQPPGNFIDYHYILFEQKDCPNTSLPSTTSNYALVCQAIEQRTQPNTTAISLPRNSCLVVENKPKPTNTLNTNSLYVINNNKGGLSASVTINKNNQIVVPINKDTGLLANPENTGPFANTTLPNSDAIYTRIDVPLTTGFQYNFYWEPLTDIVDVSTIYSTAGGGQPGQSTGLIIASPAADQSQKGVYAWGKSTIRTETSPITLEPSYLGLGSQEELGKKCFTDPTKWSNASTITYTPPLQDNDITHTPIPQIQDFGFYNPNNTKELTGCKHPVRIPIPGEPTKVAVGGSASTPTYAAISNNTLYMWGGTINSLDSQKPQLIPNQSQKVLTTPTPINLPCNPTDISISTSHVVVGCQDQIVTWGDNSQGQIGNNTTSRNEAPYTIQAQQYLTGLRNPTITKVFALPEQTYIVAKEGTGNRTLTLGWGYNTINSLGIPTSIYGQQVTKPTIIPFFEPINKIQYNSPQTTNFLVGDVIYASNWRGRITQNLDQQTGGESGTSSIGNTASYCAMPKLRPSLGYAQECQVFPPGPGKTVKE